jgi:hypothetical protein
MLSAEDQAFRRRAHLLHFAALLRGREAIGADWDRPFGSFIKTAIMPFFEIILFITMDKIIAHPCLS